MPLRLQVAGDDFAPRAGQRYHLFHKFRPQQALLVIRQEQGIVLRDSGFQVGPQTRLRVAVHRVASLVVNPHHLLRMGDDARLERGGTRGVGKQARASGALPRLTSRGASARAVRADDARDGGDGPQSAEVVDDVGRAAGNVGVALGSTTMTGASGEMRRTRPQTYSSSITSPTTRMLPVGESVQYFLRALFLHGCSSVSRIDRDDGISIQHVRGQVVRRQAVPALATPHRDGAMVVLHQGL